ncbi:PIR Superfamily Protein [Plasmodium ovale wallikeri]|uniref:PIR Superfamily Protein n=2 Tax=Plasmodium ovale TaxID=36330 RepID=A0A1A9ARK1_PLAOA|nr:PIR Superfamily Protein [Plasmodium ovale wallikeri]SBT58842.1 PIR Superfamily Protein [Plasmodium ovale wallikeri]SBT73730.1 PIR protein [Plasmodium ovale]
MTTSISVNELPSKKFNNIWDEGICKSEVTDIITHKKGPEAAYTWMKNFRKEFTENLEKHQAYINDDAIEKRCRDLYYIIYDILYELKNLENYEDSTHNTIKETIKGYIRSAFINKNYWICLSSLFNEDYYEHVNLKNKKYIDNLCEDISYIEKNINQINSSLECSGIKVYIEEEFRRHKLTYNLDNEVYTKILEYYKKSNFDSLKDIIEKIKCTTGVELQETALLGNQETPVDSIPLHIFIAPILSLCGFLLIFLFLYKVTPFRSWFYGKIRKKFDIKNNVNDEISNEILEKSCKYLQENSYNDEYNVLYDSIADI